MFNKVLTIIFVIAFIAVLFMSENIVKAQLVEDGLVGYWSFDNIAGKTVKGAVGGHDGTIAEGELSTVDGRTGKALEFDGSGAYVEIDEPDSFVCNADFTWSAWIKTDAAGVIMAKTSKEPGSDVQGAKTLFINNGTLTIDEVAVYERALNEEEIKQNFVAEGFAVVDFTNKLAGIWGKIKVSR